MVKRVKNAFPKVGHSVTHTKLITAPKLTSITIDREPQEKNRLGMVNG